MSYDTHRPVTVAQAAASPDNATERVELPAGARFLGAILGRHFGNAGAARAAAIFGDMLKAGYLVVAIHTIEEGEARFAAPAWSADPAPPEYRDREWAQRPDVTPDVWGAYETIRVGRQWLALEYERTLALAAVNDAQLAALQTAKAQLTKPGSFAADLAAFDLEQRKPPTEPDP